MGDKELPAEELVEFHEWARSKAIGYSLSFSDAENVWEAVHTISSAKAERYYMKKTHSLKFFMEQWKINAECKHEWQGCERDGKFYGRCVHCGNNPHPYEY